MEIIPAHKTKRMLKCPGSTVEIAVLSGETRNGNLHPWQVLEMPLPHPHVGHRLRFHLPRHFCPEIAGELLLVPRCPDGACLHWRLPAELHMCQELLGRAPLHPSFPPSISVLRHRSLPIYSTGFLQFYKPGPEQPFLQAQAPWLLHPG